jgi:hypothetical protein
LDSTSALQRQLEASVWSDSEALVPENAAVFHQIVELSHELLTRAMDAKEDPRLEMFDRTLCLLAAKLSHLLRAAWMATMSGYPGACQPLVRALLETCLTMFYLRRFPEAFSIWVKETKTKKEEMQFWPGAMMRRLKSPDIERSIFQLLAQQAHATALSITLLGSYDAERDILQIDIGIKLPLEKLTFITDSLCLYAALASHTVARTVRDSLVEGVATEDEVKGFFSKVQAILEKRTHAPSVEGTNVFEFLEGRQI